MLALLKDIRGRHPALRMAMTAAALLGAFAFQIPIQREVPGEPFLLFLLTVIAAAVVCGEEVGLFGAVLSAVLSGFFFEPSLTFGLAEAADFVKIELYVLLSCACAIGAARIGSALLAAQQSTEQLTVAERRKSILLTEVAHRVANNFAAVATLIRSKSIAVNDVKAKSVLDDALGQIMVMARIHKRLHSVNDDALVDSEAFILELCRDLQSSIARGRNISIEPIALRRELPLAQAVPLGLILNELVTNAVKYAFADGRSGVVRVVFCQVAGLLSLTVEDNGIGIVGECQGSGLGQHLTKALAEQLGGRLSLERIERGSIARLEFPGSDVATARKVASRVPVLQPPVS